jgi:hypothetical protein
MMKIDLASLIPETTSNGYRIDMIKNKTHVTLSYKCKFSRPESLMIKRFVNLDELFFEGFGLIEGDGDKVKFVAFTNSEFAILNHFLDFMERCFDVSREVFRVRLFLPVCADPEHAKNKVIGSLRIKESQLSGFDFRSNHRSMVVNLYKRTVLLDIVFRKLYEFSRKMARQNKVYAIPYLRGVIAAEGTVQRRNTTRSVFAVKISSIKPDNTNLYKNLLKLCNLEFGKNERDCIPIRHLRNFAKMESYELLRVSEAKNKKFTEGLKILKAKKGKMLDCGVTKGRIIKILNSKGPMTIPELLREIRKTRKTQDRPSLYDHVWDLEKQDEVKRVGTKTVQRPYHQIIVWSIANPSE